MYLLFVNLLSLPITASFPSAPPPPRPLNQPILAQLLPTTKYVLFVKHFFLTIPSPFVSSSPAYANYRRPRRIGGRKGARADLQPSEYRP